VIVYDLKLKEAKEEKKRTRTCSNERRGR